MAKQVGRKGGSLRERFFVSFWGEDFAGVEIGFRAEFTN